MDRLTGAAAGAAIGLILGLFALLRERFQFRCNFAGCRRWAVAVAPPKEHKPGGFVCNQHKKDGAIDLDAVRFIARIRRQPVEQVAQDLATSATTLSARKTNQQEVAGHDPRDCETH